MEAYEFSKDLFLGKKEFQPKPATRYSVPNRPVNNIIKQEPAEVEVVRKEPIRTSSIFEDLDDEDVLDEVPQAVKLSAKEQKEIEAEPEPEPADEYTEEEDNE